MKSHKYIILSLFLTSVSQAQNLVPNASFEEVLKPMTRWTSEPEMFDKNVRFWTSPNEATPDILFTKGMDRMFPTRLCFDKLPEHKPHTGNFMAAIRIYGCDRFESHCKEYLQVKLKFPLEKGKEYIYGYWTNPIKRLKKVSHLGVGFNIMEINDKRDNAPVKSDWYKMREEVIGRSGNWQLLMDTFVAQENYQYMIIGTFAEDEDMESMSGDRGCIPMGYYFIDDVFVVEKKNSDKIKDLFKSKNKNKIIAEKENFKNDKIYTFDNLEFEFGKAEIKEESFSELDSLMNYLINNSDLNIKIQGHTDNIGSEEDNMKLSLLRSQKVAAYLSQMINPSRIKIFAYGESRPLVENNSEINKEKNRRVEFILYSDK